MALARLLRSLCRAVVRVACVAALSLSLALVGCSGPAHPVPAMAVAAVPASAPGAAVTARPVRLWQDASIFGLVGELIASARQRVLVEVYEIGRTDLVRELGAAKARGVAVRVISDPTVVASRAAAAALDVLGVPERLYPVDDGRHQIDHVKLLIADGEAAVGGMNWGKHSDTCWRSLLTGDEVTQRMSAPGRSRFSTWKRERPPR